MEFKNVIEERHSCRSYRNEKVSKDILIDIFSDAILAPSAHNKQPWRYLILTEDKKAEIIAVIRKQIDSKSELSNYEKIMRNSLSFIENAYALVLIYTETSTTTINDYLSLGAGIENACLSATNHGVNSLWMGVILDFAESINSYLNIDDKVLVSSMLLGYAENNEFVRIRKDLNQVLFFNNF